MRCPESREPVGASDVATEYRDSRFAELDAQVRGEEAVRQQKPAAKPRRRRRTVPRLPAAVRSEIAQFAHQLKRQYRRLFIADSKLRDRASRFLRSLLPPRGKRGRPGLASVSKAILLLRKFRRLYPNEKPEQIWKRIYPQAISDYAVMAREQQKAERLLLRERVRSRTSLQQRRRL